MSIERWDAAELLKTPEAQAAYLEEAFADGDPRLIAMAIGTLARARGVDVIAARTGISRAALYKAFSENGNPTLATLTKIMAALGLKLKPIAA